MVVQTLQMGFAGSPGGGYAKEVGTSGQGQAD